MRQRYQNPLPLPPFGPKALQIGTDVGRFGRSLQTLRATEEDRPVAFVADAELGLPLDVGNTQDPISFLSGKRDLVEFDPSLGPSAAVHPQDEELLLPVEGSSANATAAASKVALAPRAQSRPSTSHITWLRRPEADGGPMRAATSMDRSASIKTSRRNVQQLTL